MTQIYVQDIIISNERPFVFIGGPCAMESAKHAVFMATELKNIADDLDIPFIFKTSFDKANRTSIASDRGVGYEKSLDIFKEIQSYGIPILTDVHEEWQCEGLAEFVDILQIPAFLCRQTDLITAAAYTQKVINIKKGQFLAPADMKHAVRKIEAMNNHNILITDRGTSFGYNTLVSDMRGIPIMQRTGYPVIFDATHSVQQPGGQGETSGGDSIFVPVLARASIAVGVAGIFMECHDNPDEAFSDGPNMIPLHEIGDVLARLKQFDEVAKGPRNRYNSYDSGDNE